MVTVFMDSAIDKYIEESLKIASLTVMDSQSMIITMSMTVNGRKTANTEKEYSRTEQLEELKEDFMKGIKSKKSLK